MMMKNNNNNQPMMVAVFGWGRMRWALEGWTSRARGEEEDDGGGGSATQPKSVGDVMREAEKEETMDRGGRGNNDNADNCCYGGAMLGRRRGGKLGQSGTKKDND
jgi:hypothetical protein